jgi:DNA-binding protein H-NS
MLDAEKQRLVARAQANGYAEVRVISPTQVVALDQKLFTWGLILGADHDRPDGRYCFEGYTDAHKAFETWDGQGHPPGPWIKKFPEEILGPGALDQPQMQHEIKNGAKIHS